jgi:hypothetical protein
MLRSAPNARRFAAGRAPPRIEIARRECRRTDVARGPSGASGTRSRWRACDARARSRDPTARSRWRLAAFVGLAQTPIAATWRVFSAGANGCARPARSRDSTKAHKDRANRVGVFDRGNQPQAVYRRRGPYRSWQWRRKSSRSRTNTPRTARQRGVRREQTAKTMRKTQQPLAHGLTSPCGAPSPLPAGFKSSSPVSRAPGRRPA